MKVIANEKLIRRNGRIGQFASLAALIVLAAGMYVSFARPELFLVAAGALLVGFILSQIGIYFGNRWGRNPRPHALLSQALKGLTNEYTLYHYNTPASHLLVGPAGIWVLMALYQRGEIRYDPEKGRWRQRGGGFAASYMRLFGAEHIGRPDLDAAAEVESVRQYLQKRLGTEKIPPVNAALVFLSDKAELDVAEAPLPAMPARKIKDFIRQVAKTQPMAPAEQARIKELLPKE